MVYRKSLSQFKIVGRRCLTIILLGIFLFSFANVSAAGFDNKKNSEDIIKGDSFIVGDKELPYNPIWETYKPIQIDNWLGLGKTLFRGALTKHDDVCGVNCSSTMEIYLAEDSVLIDDVNFYTLNEVDGKTNQRDNSWVEQDIRSYQFYYNDIPYSLGEEVPKGNYEVRLDGQKSPKRTVDWVIETQGETLTSLATWGGNYFEGTEYQLIILADSVDEAGLSINGVTVNETATGIWKLNSTGTSTQAKNKIMKNLFYGTDGSDPRATSTYITNPTAVYSNNITDDGKRGYYVQYYKLGGANNENVSYTATFADTTTNTNCLVGGYAASGGNSGYSHDVRVEYSAGTLITGGNSMSEATSDDDTASPTYKDNQPNMRLLFYTRGLATASCTLRAYILAKGTVSYSQSGNPSGATPTTTDFYTDESFPLITYLNAYTELNSPADDYISDNETVNFNCTAHTAGGATLTNITFWHNATGTWASNQTHDRTGITNSTTFNLTLTDGEYVDWTCAAGDSDGDSGFSLTNRTFSIDLSSTTINITYPETSWNYGREGNNITLNWTVSDTNLESCWFEYNNTNTSVSCADQNASFILDNQPNITFYANDSVGHETNFTRSWTYKLFGNSESYNSTSYETATEGFRINMTATGSQTITANFSYNGTVYPGTKVGNGTYMEFYKNFGGLPVITTPTATNISFFWEVYYGTQNINTTANNMSVGRTVFGLCNATLTTPYINFTFADEETTIATNATFDSSTWIYYLGDGTVNKSLLYSTTDANESYGFCFTPTDKTMKKTLSLQYSDTGYPQRRWTSTASSTNTTTNQKLYMLASADGTYSVYQVQNSVGSGIEDASIQVERQFSGVWTLIEEGTTDSAGGVTFWLNPDYDHRISVTAIGYTSTQVTVRPSSSTYSIILGGGGASAATYNNTLDGVSWLIWPTSGAGGFSDSKYFGVNVTSTLGNIIGCRFDIVNKTETLGTTTGCGAYGGNITVNVDASNHTRLWGQFYLDVGDGYQMVEGDAYWYNITSDIATGTLLSALQRLGSEDLSIFGENCDPGEPCRAEYSRIIFFFFALFIGFGMISLNTGWDFSTRGGMILALFPIILFASIVGLLRIDMIMVESEFLKQYTAAIIAAFFTLGWIFNELGNS